MKIAIIGVQGDISEHMVCLKNALTELHLKAEVVWAVKANHLYDVDGIIIPGGESTVISRLLTYTGMGKAIQELAKKNIPILGTCAGAILLSQRNKNGFPKGLSVIDIKVDRNAYGRQKNSFETSISTPAGKTKGVFIRAPMIKSFFGKAKIFARYKNKIIGVKQRNIIALTFHPELSGDTKIHKYFLSLINKNQ